MSFDTLKVAELREIAEYFAVDLDGAKSKSAVLKALEEEGITFDMYAKFAGAEKAELDIAPKKEKKPANGPSVLVKMDRTNAMYQVNGHLFTREHPYVAMSEEDAEFIFDTEEGFRMATPREIQEYYN